VGSWGRIDRKTGKFDFEGNVYTDKKTSELASEHPPIMGKEEKELVICSKDGRKVDVGAGPEA
jgi:hypothetical protein